MIKSKGKNLLELKWNVPMSSLVPLPLTTSTEYNR